MRRGRPTKAGDDVKVPKPSPSPLRPAAGDPFSALDSRPVPASDAEVDEISSRFPALDDFSLLHDKGSRFSFDPKSETAQQPKQDISVRVTNALADDLFAQAKTSVAPKSHQDTPSVHSAAPIPNARPSSSHNAPTRQSSRPISTDQQPAQKSTMVSTGTMTSPSPSPTLKAQPISNRPIFRFPTPTSRSSSQPRKSDADQSKQDVAEMASRPNLLQHRTKSQILTADSSKLSRAPSDSSHRPTYLSGLDDSVHRSKSANSKSRPSSMQTSKPSILRRLSRERSSVDSKSQEAVPLNSPPTGETGEGEEAMKIDSNVEYLKAMEEEDSSKRQYKRASGGSKHVKRSSMPSVSLSGTKSMLAGRFGEAFRKFETSNGPERREPNHSPVRGSSDLTPIAGSEATDGRSDDGNFVEAEEVPPEVRRELERRRLSQEERRVADAGAAYKKRMAEGGDAKPPPAGKALTIQSKVRSLLDESGRASPSPTKTAEGYGKFTDRQPWQNPQPQRQTTANLPPRTSSRQTNVSSSLSSTPNPQTSSRNPYPVRTTASKPDAEASKPPAHTHPPRLQTSATAPPDTHEPSSQLPNTTRPPKTRRQPPATTTTRKPPTKTATETPGPPHR